MAEVRLKFVEGGDQALHEPSISELMSVEMFEVNVHRRCLLLKEFLSVGLIKIEGLVVLNLLVQVLLILTEIGTVIGLIGSQLEIEKEVEEAFLHDSVDFRFL